MGRVRFAHFDMHIQASKKVLLATEKNVFASINTRTGELCEYIVSGCYSYRTSCIKKINLYFSNFLPIDNA